MCHRNFITFFGKNFNCLSFIHTSTLGTMETLHIVLGCLILFQTTATGIADEKIYIQDLSRQGIQTLSNSTLYLIPP